MGDAELVKNEKLARLAIPVSPIFLFVIKKVARLLQQRLRNRTHLIGAYVTTVHQVYYYACSFSSRRQTISVPNFSAQIGAGFLGFVLMGWALVPKETPI